VTVTGTAADANFAGFRLRAAPADRPEALVDVAPRAAVS